MVCSTRGIPGVKVTSITPVSQGAIGSLGKSGTVQVHGPFTLVKNSGWFPVLVTVNMLE